MPLPIKVRISERSPQPQDERKDARTNFWYRLQNNSTIDGRQIDELEGHLRREFGRALARHLLGGIFHELSGMENVARGDASLWHLLDLPRREEGTYWDGTGTAISRYIEFRQQLIANVPSYANVIERLSSASRVLFSVTIRDYASLNLDLDIAPIDKLAAAFESDFDTFRVFLNVFIPVTFGDIFTEDFADSFSYDIDIPKDFKNAFESVPTRSEALKSAPAQITVPSQSSSTPTGADSQRRAEWLWRLANGSLLVPVVLALVVPYFGWREMSDRRGVQEKALDSVLDHQQKLLEQDRQRIEKLLQPPASAKPGGTDTAPAATKSTPAAP
jgi:hypothetical protein